MKHPICRLGGALFPLFLLALPCAPAHADMLGQNWYAGFSGDLTWMSRTDTGYGGNADLGYRFRPSDFGDARLEGELGYHRADNKNISGDTHFYTYMVNAYYDFNLFHASDSQSRIMPYVGAGLGDTTANFGAGDHGNAFAYQFMAGLTLTPASSPNTDWSLGWRYQGSSNVSGNGLSESLSANSLELGLRFHF